MIDDSLKEIIPDFLDEASTYLDTMNDSLLKLEGEVGNTADSDTINNLFRAAHSLKGASGMLGFISINKVTHRMENVFSSIRDHKLDLQSDIVDILLKGLDIINSLINDLSQKSNEDTQIDEIVEMLEGILKNTKQVKKDLAEEVKGSSKADKQTDTTDKRKEDSLKQGNTLSGHQSEAAPLQPAKKKEEPDVAESSELDSDNYRQIFIEEVEDDLEKLTERMLQLEKDVEDRETINAIFRLAHRLKGNFAVFGYVDIANLAHRVEDILEKIRKGELKADKQLIDLFLLTIDKFKAFIANLSKGEDTNIDISDIVGHLQGYSPSDGSEEEFMTPNDKPPVDEEADAAKLKNEEINSKISLTDSDKSLIEKAQRQDVHVYLIEVFFDKGVILGFERAFLIVNNLLCIGEVLKVRPDLDKIPQESNVNSISVIVATNSAEKEIRRVVNVDLVKQVDIKKFEKVSKEGGADVQKNKNAKEGEHVQTSIRVDSARLDHMMNLAGELIIIKSRFSLLTTEFRNLFINKELLYMLDEITFKLGRIGIELSTASKNQDKQKNENIIKMMESHLQVLSHDFNKLEKNIKNIIKNKMFMLDLYETTNKLGKVCTGIQTGVMQVRMVPIGPLLKRFTRTVRDVARKCGKKIELVIKGEDTELDKNIIDGLGNPLTHMIRNAADHGIESIEERVKAGKPEKGTIHLSAYHEGSFICVEVADDGKGLPVEKIKKKAVTNGLKTEDELASMTDKEIFDLIFMPGFSTKSTVSDISGRGVGMDVVRQNVSEMKGIVAIESEEGHGSKFTIKLPLTLAIITALLVKISEEIYCIPLESVEEIVCLKQKEIYTVEGAQTFKLRGKVLPLLCLDELFHAERNDNASSSLTIVVIKSNENLAGLIVDTLVGEQEIVIKSLGDEFKDIKGISGASILGDGALSLILDTGEVIQMGMSSEPA